jgi:hypothetical protein
MNHHLYIFCSARFVKGRVEQRIGFKKMAKLKIINRYGVIPQKVLYNPSLSLKAKGLFGYMQSKPDTWKFSARRIAQECKDGKESIESALKELEEAGYLVRNKYQTSNGTWDWEHELSEKPWAGKPTLDKPALEKPTTIQEGFSKKDIVKSTSIFSWEKSQEKMMEKEGSDMDIIATYLIEKKIVPKDAAELSGYIKRYRKIAKDIQPFVGSDFKKFWQAVDVCKEESYRLGYDWKLETLYKKITNIK